MSAPMNWKTDHKASLFGRKINEQKSPVKKVVSANVASSPNTSKKRELESNKSSSSQSNHKHNPTINENTDTNSAKRQKSSSVEVVKAEDKMVNLALSIDDCDDIDEVMGSNVTETQDTEKLSTPKHSKVPKSPKITGKREYDPHRLSPTTIQDKQSATLNSMLKSPVKNVAAIVSPLSNANKGALKLGKFNNVLPFKSLQTLSKSTPKSISSSPVKSDMSIIIDKSSAASNVTTSKPYDPSIVNNQKLNMIHLSPPIDISKLHDLSSRYTDELVKIIESRSHTRYHPETSSDDVSDKTSRMISDIKKQVASTNDNCEEIHRKTGKNHYEIEQLKLYLNEQIHKITVDFDTKMQQRDKEIAQISQQFEQIKDQLLSKFNLLEVSTTDKLDHNTKEIAHMTQWIETLTS